MTQNSHPYHAPYCPFIWGNNALNIVGKSAIISRNNGFLYFKHNKLINFLLTKNMYYENKF